MNTCGSCKHWAPPDNCCARAIDVCGFGWCQIIGSSLSGSASLHVDVRDGPVQAGTKVYADLITKHDFGCSLFEQVDRSSGPEYRIKPPTLEYLKDSIEKPDFNRANVT